MRNGINIKYSVYPKPTAWPFVWGKPLSSGNPTLTSASADEVMSRGCGVRIFLCAGDHVINERNPAAGFGCS